MIGAIHSANDFIQAEANTMIEWTESWEQALTQSGETGKPVFLFLYAVG